jgi:chemosensory pili system protein ChpC
MAERISEIYSLLVPLLDGRLIIPRSCVAEVVGFQQPSEMPGAPPWYLGMFAWSNRQIPLISFEGTCGQTIPPLTGRTRVVVLFALGAQIEGGYYGIVSQGFPQLVRVSADILRPDPTKTFTERTPIISQVRMINEAPWIPDLERIEEMVAEETSVLVE